MKKVVTDYERTLDLAASGPRVLFTLLAGPWSDKHGRKLLIIVVDRSDFLPKIPNRTEPIKFLPNRSDTEPNRSRFFFTIFEAFIFKLVWKAYFTSGCG